VGCSAVLQPQRQDEGQLLQALHLQIKHVGYCCVSDEGLDQGESGHGHSRTLAAVQPTHAHANDEYTRRNVLERLRAAAVDASRNTQAKAMIDLIVGCVHRIEEVIVRV
jgi:hypothetical protein